MWTFISLVCLLVLLARSSSAFIKCCPHGYAFANDLRCVVAATDNNSTIIFEKLAFGNETESCYRSAEGVTDLHHDELTLGNNITEVETCMDLNYRNETVYTMPCPVDWRERLGKCDSVFKPIFFWGASIVIFANLVYILPYFIVVALCLAVADLRSRAYDKAVLSYNASQFVIALALIVLGYYVLCHEPIRPIWLYIIFGLGFQFFTISSVFWINVICFDMTLVITRLRWIPGSDVTGAEDRRKFRRYAACAWGIPAIITAITCFIELSPWIPSTVKPNFEKFDDGANYGVIAYVGVVPIIALILNNALFIYTTYKVIKLQKSSAVAHENNKNVRKKYFIFLRLYLVMDAPWILGVMAASYSNLWILKFIRMIQPILMLIAILPKKKFYQAIKCCKTPTAAKTNPATAKNKGGDTRC